MKKAFEFFAQHKIEYEFIDYKNCPPSFTFLESLDNHIALQNKGGLHCLINTKGTTYKKLKSEYPNIADAQDISKEMIIAHPSILKRPLILVQCNGDISEVLIGLEQLEYIISGG